MNFQSSLLIVSQFCSAVHSKVSLEALKNQRQEIWHPPFVLMTAALLPYGIATLRNHNKKIMLWFEN